MGGGMNAIYEGKVWQFTNSRGRTEYAPESDPERRHLDPHNLTDATLVNCVVAYDGLIWRGPFRDMHDAVIFIASLTFR